MTSQIKISNITTGSSQTVILYNTFTLLAHCGIPRIKKMSLLAISLFLTTAVLNPTPGALLFTDIRPILARNGDTLAFEEPIVKYVCTLEPTLKKEDVLNSAVCICYIYGIPSRGEFFQSINIGLHK